MNNLMLRFSAADVSRLRALVAGVEKEMALVLSARTRWNHLPALATQAKAA